MSRENPQAVKITEALTHFITLDDQPLSVVENVGFRRLLSTLEPRYEIPSRSYITDVMVPKLFEDVKKNVRNLVKAASALSFTTDIWTSSVCPMSLISLTAQWIDEEFVRHHVTLHAKSFRGSHTSQTIAGAFDSMLQTWNIPKMSVHAVVRDNARNMITVFSNC